MARKRMVSPEFFTSTTMSKLPITTRMTFIGLWVYVDDAGREKDNALAVKAAVWPLDRSMTEKKVADDLERLASHGSICRYSCCDEPQLHIPEWTDWQKISHPTPSRRCVCPAHDPDGHKEHLDKLRSDSGANREGSGATPPSVVKPRLDEISAAAAKEPPPQSPPEELPTIGILRQRLSAAGLTASWSTLTDAQKLEVCELVVKHGGDGPLIEAAKRMHRPDDPAVYATAWLKTWREIPTSAERLRAVGASYCSEHTSTRLPCGLCFELPAVAQ